MKRINIFMIVLLSSLAIFVLPGCSAIAGIFKAGVWTGLILVAIVIGIILFIVSRGTKK